MDPHDQIDQLGHTFLVLDQLKLIFGQLGGNWKNGFFSFLIHRFFPGCNVRPDILTLQSIWGPSGVEGWAWEDVNQGCWEAGRPRHLRKPFPQTRREPRRRKIRLERTAALETSNIILINNGKLTFSAFVLCPTADFVHLTVEAQKLWMCYKYSLLSVCFSAVMHSSVGICLTVTINNFYGNVLIYQEP